MTAEEQMDEMGHERREHRRFSKKMHAHLRERGHSGHVVEIFNVSISGCTIDASGLVGGFNRPIWLRLGELSSLQAKLVWSNGQRAGLKFDNELHEAVLERLVEGPKGSDYAPSLTQMATTKDVVTDGVGESRSEQILRGYAEPSLLARKKPIGDRELSSLIERRVTRNTDTRRETRYPSDCTSGPEDVSLTDSDAKVADISPSGLGLSGESQKSIGEKVEVTFPNCEPIKGMMIWKREDRFGVALDDDAIDIEAA